jgi:hypothetical protein
MSLWIDIRVFQLTLSGDIPNRFAGDFNIPKEHIFFKLNFAIDNVNNISEAMRLNAIVA